MSKDQLVQRFKIEFFFVNLWHARISSGTFKRRKKFHEDGTQFTETELFDDSMILYSKHINKAFYLSNEIFKNDDSKVEPDSKTVFLGYFKDKMRLRDIIQKYKK